MNTPENKQSEKVNRRDAIKTLFTLAAAYTATGCKRDADALRSFFQTNFREMSPEQLASTVERWERRYEKRFDREVKVSTTPPQEDVLFGYALDVSRCIGCRRCVYACVEENNQSRDPQIHWIQVLEMDKAKGIDLMHADAYYDAEEVPQEDKFYFPVQCQQCENPPCVKSCPVGATWKEPDGIVVIDYDWCVGCRCCVTACPYGARHFNWTKPSLPVNQLNPDTEYLGNRPRPQGVVEKCTFCLQRARKGRYPACVEVCPVGARKFGNLLDPKGEIRYILENHRIYILKEELNTQPKFFYYFSI
ncbi:4Fe-4S dicluster domain-containing protein [Puniceicoccales bacterium CK1056]|uniref:4Fe-4S dicluster domain-containing protein n=1 Tax=Oceanipulchritudo coccoides TaxID=2706888 RepID=A0A6B2M3L1_9BACT|nr:4Fe-4S dicluster domain-containing protein [Oceanipulchritudo coccoides]NDV63548.1 4Fe-4S dicluster domain-containing protein [Oceanipulchritudo coccoides]